MNEYIIGIDGGGTKTEAICSDLSGATLGQGLSGPTNLTSTSVGAASFNLIESIRQALETVDQENMVIKKIVLGLAGMDTNEERERALNVFQRALSHHHIEHYELVNDSVIALENGSSNPNAVVLVAGTGSISFGRNAQGETAKTGGMDFLLTDQGSGYYIGRQVLREAVKSYDGRSEKNLLEKLVCDHFQILSIAELKNEVYNPLLSKIEIADLAPICTQAYDQGDEAAKHIFEHAVSELILLASTVIEKLKLDQGSFDLVLSGAVTRLPQMQTELINQFKQKYPALNLAIPDTPPVYGAIKLALNGI